MTTMEVSPPPPPPPRQSPTPSDGSGANRDASAPSGAAPAAAVGGVAAVSAGVCTAAAGGQQQQSARNIKASQAASIAAVVESTSANRDLIPGLAELVGGMSGGGVPFLKSGSSVVPGGGDATAKVITTGGAGPASTTEGPMATATVIAPGAGGVGESVEKARVSPPAAAAGHPSLPSKESVSSAASRLVNENPPFVTMSARDSAPQLKLEDPPVISDDVAKVDFKRNLVVKGGMKGYRMSRASHGVSKGCYYYEVIILGSDSSTGRGVKRTLDEATGTSKENEEKNEQCMNGHLRLGWSTRSADLQAPVGYNEHSYAIRDILGSRIHKSRREDRWGGESFGPGDVLGVMICLVDGTRPVPKATPRASTASLDTDAGASAAESRRESVQDAEMKDAESVPKLTNHIRFFKNGKPMGEGGIAFDNIVLGTYHPSVSCYAESAVLLNFGPTMVYGPPKDLPAEMLKELRTVSELCTPPPEPEVAVERVLSSGSSSRGKEGNKAFFTKRTDDAIVAAFRELVGTEAKVRRDAYLRHGELHEREVAALKKERGVPT